jgi:hypothetical protein
MSKTKQPKQLCKNCEEHRCWAAILLPHEGDRDTSKMKHSQQSAYSKENLMVKKEIGKVIKKQLAGEKKDYNSFGCRDKKRCPCLCQEKRKKENKTKAKHGKFRLKKLGG